MKAGFIQALYALKDLPEGSEHVALIATTDEETGSATSKNLIKEISAKAQAVLVLEASLDGKVKTGRKGTAMYQVTVHGRSSHAGLEPEKGINATTEIAHIVLALLALENPEHGTTVVPTTMQSGTSTNSVPDSARLDIDVRSFSTDDLTRIDSAVRALQPTIPGATLEITGSINRPPLQPTSTQELYLIAEKVAADMIESPIDVMEHFLRLQNWNDRDRNISWGNAYAPNALINTSTREGGFDYAELNDLRTIKAARQILDEGDVVADSGRALGRERPAVPAVQQHAVQHVAHSLHGT
jgi:hypothetical protein